MKPEPGREAAPADQGWVAFYRLQARLMWEWRPTRLAILRRAILSFLGACLALAITAGVVPELQVDGLAPLLLAGLLLLALDSTLAVVLHGLLVGLPIFIAQLLGVVAQFAAIIALGRLLPGIHVGDTAAAVWGAIFLTVLNSLFAEIVAVSDEDAIAWARRLHKEEGVFCGISSGAAMCAAAQLAADPANKGKMIVAILPSIGERYLSTALFEQD